MMRSGRWWVLAGAACGVAAAAWWMTRPETSAGPCMVVNGPASLPDVAEASGLAVSRRHAGVLWSHNDSGNEPVLFAIGRDGAPRGRVRVPAGMRDWEDISAARCAAGDCLYLADIGDNREVRSEVSIYRVPEPALGDATTATPERLRVKYVDGPHNAESLFIIGSEMFIITRDRSGIVYRSEIPDQAGEMTMARVGELGIRGVSDAETSTDGRSVVVRTQREVMFYRTADLVAGRISAPYFRLRVDGLGEPQGEGVAVDGNMLFLASEGRPWTSGGEFIGLSCTDGSIALR